MTLQQDPMATRSVLPHWWAHHSSSTGAHKVLRLLVIAGWRCAGVFRVGSREGPTAPPGQAMRSAPYKSMYT